MELRNANENRCSVGKTATSHSITGRDGLEVKISAKDGKFGLVLRISAVYYVHSAGFRGKFAPGDPDHLSFTRTLADPRSQAAGCGGRVSLTSPPLSLSPQTAASSEESVRKELEALLDRFFSPSATNEQRLKLSMSPHSFYPSCSFPSLVFSSFP